MIALNPRVSHSGCQSTAACLRLPVTKYVQFCRWVITVAFLLLWWNTLTKKKLWRGKRVYLGSCRRDAVHHSGKDKAAGWEVGRSHPPHTQEGKGRREQWVGQEKNSKSVTRLGFLNSLWPSQTVPPSGGQVLRHRSLWRKLCNQNKSIFQGGKLHWQIALHYGSVFPRRHNSLYSLALSHSG